MDNTILKAKKPVYIQAADKKLLSLASGLMLLVFSAGFLLFLRNMTAAQGQQTTQSYFSFFTDNPLIDLILFVVILSGFIKQNIMLTLIPLGAGAARTVVALIDMSGMYSGYLYMYFMSIQLLLPTMLMVSLFVVFLLTARGKIKSRTAFVTLAAAGIALYINSIFFVMSNYRLTLASNPLYIPYGFWDKMSLYSPSVCSAVYFAALVLFGLCLRPCQESVIVEEPESYDEEANKDE